MTDPAASTLRNSGGQAGAKRHWYHSVAGRLLIAFMLIAMLTVVGTAISIARFGNLSIVLHRLIEVSLPAVKSSLGIETNATQVAITAGQLGNVEDSVALFEQNEKLTGQIAQLWSGLNTLRSVVGDASQTMRLQEEVAAIDQKVGELNRAASEKIVLFHRGRQLAAGLMTAANGLSASVDTLRQAATAAPTLNELTAQIARQVVLLGMLVTQAENANKPEQLAALRRQFAADRESLTKEFAALANLAPADGARLSELKEQIDAAFEQIGGDRGLLNTREAELRTVSQIGSLQDTLRKSSDGLRDQVQAVVQQAETESGETADRSLHEIAQSRWWLILIALASLALAILVVWQFVLRYVVSRLTELSRSMLAIAQGNTSAPIPAAGPDELGDMSRSLAVFRENAREIRSAREQAEKSQAEAEAASRTKSAFLANMSHELRTPLNAIIGYSEILIEDATDRGDKASITDLEKIQGAGKHLLGLINDILDLSKIEAGRMDVYLEQVFLSRLMDDVKIIVEPMIKKNDNRLLIECPVDVGSLQTDLSKLKQSLINLLSNAAKFTKQGDITLKVWRETQDGQPWIKFAVTDRGIGMTDEQLGRLFQAFTQADSSTTRNFGGTGLGLTITKHFCTMLGGTIGVTSTPDKGSTFTISLPDQPAKPAAAEAEEIELPVSEAPPHSISVLVVDDDPAVHDVLSPTLRKEGYRVTHARDGQQALEMMRKMPPDIVTLDVMMPKVDGWSVLGIMKSDPDLEHIPVIMLTIVDDRNLGFSLGASEFMTKPIERNKLIALLRKFAPSGEGGVVLIVDDDPDVRSVVKNAIEGAGLKTAEANNGRIALDWLKNHSMPSLVLLDLMMPEMDGFEFLERVRADEKLARLPVVVLTAKDLTEAERNFLAEQTILVLSKNAQPIATLGKALSAIANRGRAAQAPQRVH
jgi:signal transduction histidine kinase/CheY-like chemotaxis protein